MYIETKMYKLQHFSIYAVFHIRNYCNEVKIKKFSQMFENLSVLF